MKTLIITLAVMILGCILSGCMPSRGWQFQVGISPVSAIDHNQVFTAPDVVPAKSKRSY